MKDTKNVSLFINCATKALQFGLLTNEGFFLSDKDSPKKALEHANIMIDNLLKEHSLTLKDVRNFYCLLGPGSNTGIRLGLTIVRTLYAFDSTIRIYGIKTMDLLTKENNDAVLSDRNGNLYYGTREDGSCSYTRVNKEDIETSITCKTITVEGDDEIAIDELKSHELVKVNVVSMMEKYKDSFKDYSDDEENFLPEYILSI